MKILPVPKIRDADQFTIDHEPISSLDLMERAAHSIFNHLVADFSAESVFLVLCGPGNNGGDGLVLARLLSERAAKVTVWLVYGSLQPSEENKANRIALEHCGNVHIRLLETVSQLEDECILPETIVIDALFGSGLNRKLSGVWSDLVNFVNRIQSIKVAIDIPSGLFADVMNHTEDQIFVAGKTYTLESPKYSFFFEENGRWIGNWEVVSIPLHPQFNEEVDAENFFTTQDQIRPLLKPRSLFAHKGDFGHALLIAGSYGMMGAAVLASKSCLRSGVGMLTTHVPQCGYHVMQTAVPEALVEVDFKETHFSTLCKADLNRYAAIAIGCGLSRHPDCVSGLKELIQQAGIPLVIDADALNILSENQTWLAYLPKNSILTPHVKEFERLVGKSENSLDRLQKLRAFSIKYQLVVLLKGAYTAISLPNGAIYFNSTGNPGMATAGSGDVLTGLILGLKAQGYASSEAAILGAYIHGLSADLAVEHSQSQESLIASDLFEYYGIAFAKLRQF